MTGPPTCNQTKLWNENPFYATPTRFRVRAGTGARIPNSGVSCTHGSVHFRPLDHQGDRSFTLLFIEKRANILTCEFLVERNRLWRKLVPSGGYDVLEGTHGDADSRISNTLTFSAELEHNRITQEKLREIFLWSPGQKEDIYAEKSQERRKI